MESKNLTYFNYHCFIYESDFMSSQKGAFLISPKLKEQSLNRKYDTYWFFNIFWDECL